MTFTQPHSTSPPRCVTRSLRPHKPSIPWEQLPQNEIGNPWFSFPDPYTRTTFLDPSDPNYIIIGQKYQAIQNELLGDYFQELGNRTENPTIFLWADQYNELVPRSESFDYLELASENQMKSMKYAFGGAKEGAYSSSPLHSSLLIINSQTVFGCHRLPAKKEASLGARKAHKRKSCMFQTKQKSPGAKKRSPFGSAKTPSSRPCVPMSPQRGCCFHTNGRNACRPPVSMPPPLYTHTHTCTQTQENST